MMHTSRGLAAVDDGRVSFEVRGAGAAIVLIHGFSLDMRMWDEQFDRFAQQYYVLRYDMRGFGGSDRPTRPYSHAHDLKRLLDFLEIAHATIIGLSMGAEVAIDFALAYPHMTDALIAADPAIGGYAWSDAFQASLQPRNMAMRDQGIEAAKNLWLAHPLFAPAQEKRHVAAQLRKIVSAYSFWHVLTADPALPLDPPAVGRLDQIVAPSLIIVGQRDLPDFHRMATLLDQRISDSMKVVLPNVGHMTNMEDFDRFNDAVLRFLAERRL